MSESGIKKRIFFPNLDGLRFICFFFVFMVHSFVTDDVAINNNPVHIFLKKYLFAGGQLGVNMFFVLSGFLITYLLISEREISGKINVKNFYIRRVLRIWPLYFFCVFFGFIIFPLFKSMFGEVPNETAQPIYYFFFASNFDLMRSGGADSSMLNILWSVSIEEQFYLFWPLVVMLVNKKRLWIVLLLIIIASNIFRYIYRDRFGIELHTFSAANDLGMGCITACLALQKSRLRDLLTKNNKALYIAAHVVFLTLFVAYHQVDIGSAEFIKRILFSISFALVIFLQCFSPVQLFALRKAKAMSKLGEYTYGLYCLHMIAILAVMKLFSKFYPSYNAAVLFLVIFPLTLILSIFMAKLSFRYFEAYFLKLKHKFSIISKD